ncbi:DUF554 domain-containing protein [Microaceticoccus formicicus]|uniref:DUF554 domain-containing protein n=1 Tax=Microaceticoccus formicicus TaxID=3118105 RepID=UPI003CD04B00|nr:DUF554 domain-containing protein [Peptoniphilaceae bacterium AMB_02]
MIAIIINALAVCAGGTVGIVLRNHISKRHINSIFSIMGVLTIVMGLQGVIPSDHMIFIMIALFLGSILGNFIDISGKIDSISERFSSEDGETNLISGAITIFLIQCTGALAILGPMKAGLVGEYDLIYFKAILDGASAIIFASIYGKSIYPAALLLLIYQGGIFLVSNIIEPVLTPLVIEQIGQIGSVLLVALGIEMLELKKMKVVNYLPAILIPILYTLIRGFFI